MLVGIVGILDSLFRTIDRSDEELLAQTSDRLEIALDAFYPADSTAATLILAAPELQAAEAVLQVGGTLVTAHPDHDIDLFIDLVDLESTLWRPTITDGALDRATRGIVLSAAAAADLGVKPGQTVVLCHPLRTGPAAFVVAHSELPVVGVHPHPFRFLAYIDLAHADLMGLAGATNRIVARPTGGEDERSVQRALFGLPGVASVQGVTATTDAIRDAMAQFTGVFQIIEGAALLLALLIAFNAASISEDERARENATMLAFGIPVRTILRMSVVESLRDRPDRNPPRPARRLRPADLDRRGCSSLARSPTSASRRRSPTAHSPSCSLSASSPSPPHRCSPSASSATWTSPRRCE